MKRYRHPFTWFNMVDTVAEAQSLLQEFYDRLVALQQEDNETGGSESLLYGWELKKETVGAFVTLDVEGLSIYLYPKLEGNYYDIDSIVYECGGQYILATLEDVRGRPSYVEFMKVIKYLLSPLKDKIGWINHTEVKDYCRGGRGYIVLTEDVNPRRPLTKLMKEMGLITPENFLAEQGYFGPFGETL